MFAVRNATKQANQKVLCSKLLTAAHVASHDSDAPTFDLSRIEQMLGKSLKSCWKMNFSKYNKFKSYLDIMRRAFYLPYVRFSRKDENGSRRRWKFYEISCRRRITSRWEVARGEKKNGLRVFIAISIRNFGIYELEMDQRLSVSDELSLKLMATHSTQYQSWSSKTCYDFVIDTYTRGIEIRYPGAKRENEAI